MLERLESGQTILLLDGWDELGHKQSQRSAKWLVDLVDALPGNLWVVAAGPRGYAPLTGAGFLPLTLASWSITQSDTLAKNWCSSFGRDIQSRASLQEVQSQLRRAARFGCPPLELALRAFVHLTDGTPEDQRGKLLTRALDLTLGHKNHHEPGFVDPCVVALEGLALKLHMTGDSTVDLPAVVARIRAKAVPAEGRTARDTSSVLHAITSKAGPLRAVGGNRVAFTHSVWQAFLVARQLAAIGPAQLVKHLEDTRWHEVVRFYAESGNMGPIVTAWSRVRDDSFCSRVQILSSWIRVAPTGAAWHDGSMAVLARSFLQRGLPPSSRLSLAEAMASTEASGVGYFFKTALRHSDAEIRIAALMGLSALATDSDLPALQAMLEDEVPAVRAAAVRGLSILGTSAAHRRLERELLQTDDESLALAAAKALASAGEEGEAFLVSLAHSQDVFARRVAIAGLARIGARHQLEGLAREQGQADVRSAVRSALQEIEELQEAAAPQAPLGVDDLPWLISWAASQGEGVGVGDAAYSMLHRALSEGDASVRLAAADVLGQSGRPPDVEFLRTACSDPDPRVSSAALEALVEISSRYALTAR